MSGIEIIILCGVVSVIVSVVSILVSTSYGTDWLIDWWRKLEHRWWERS
jgi:hypothetical protein